MLDTRMVSKIRKTVEETCSKQESVIIKDKLIENLKSGKRKKILIIGDLMLDNFMYGNKTKLLQVEGHYLDQDYMIKEQKSDKKIPGGSGSMALAFSQFFNVDLIGLIGEDDCEGKKLKSIFESIETKYNIKYYPINVPGWITTLKIYFYYQEISKIRSLRLNREVPFLTVEQRGYVQVKIKECIEASFKLSTPDCILIKDYEKGMLDQETIEMIAEVAKKRDIPIFVDPKYNWEKFKDIHIVSFFPNLKEACCGAGTKDEQKLYECTNSQILRKLDIEELNKRYKNSDYIIVKQGRRGCTIIENNKDGTYHKKYIEQIHDFYHRDEEIVTDIGNGDIFNACIILGFLNGAKDINQITRYALLGNIVASLKMKLEAGDFPTIEQIVVALGKDQVIEAINTTCCVEKSSV